jgi:Family of unknown function (DUF6527)
MPYLFTERRVGYRASGCIVVIERKRATSLNLRGEVSRNHEAVVLAESPGDAAIVSRGRLRAIVIACPDGCGEHITVNLDERAGQAWRVYQRPRGVTLYPSVWRESGCRSHFIIWHNAILWCDWRASDYHEPDDRDPGLHERVLGLLTSSYQSYVEIAAALDEVPWEVARSCRFLQSKGLVEEAEKPLRGCYRRTERS